MCDQLRNSFVSYVIHSRFWATALLWYMGARWISGDGIIVRSHDDSPKRIKKQLQGAAQVPTIWTPWFSWFLGLYTFHIVSILFPILVSPCFPSLPYIFASFCRVLAHPSFPSPPVVSRRRCKSSGKRCCWCYWFWGEPGSGVEGLMSQRLKDWFHITETFFIMCWRWNLSPV